MKNNFILNQLIVDPYKKNITTAFQFSTQFRNVLKKTLSFLLLLLVFKTAPAATITVSSLSALQTAINNAVPGDIITLVNGVYTSSTDIAISKKGTAAQPITIAAQTIGGSEITGTGGFSIVSPAAYIIIKGFKFTHAANHAKMGSGTSFCRWTRNIFETPGDGEYLLLNGNDHQVDYNTFQNKHDLGRFIAVRGSGSQIAQRLWIHHNYFFKQFPGGGNGAETLQFGLSGYSLSSSNSIVEHNVFEQFDGENELLSVKASAVTVRYNTIRDCPAQFTLRHGNGCIVYGNYFINTPGLRIYGDDHVIFSNHFENCSIALDIGNGDGEVANGDALTVHDRPDRVLIAFNTLVNNSSNFKQAGRTNGLGATFITVVNNIVQGGGAAASIAGPYTNPVWEGNIIFNTNGAGAMPATGYIIADPKIARNLTGTFHIQPGSPAIDAATGSYTSVIADMDGQTRVSPLDVGADEISNTQVIARILNPVDVGHAAISDVPSVRIISPIDKSILNGDSAISIAADAISFDGSIAKVEFFVDLDTRSGQTFSSRFLTKIYSFTNTTSYVHYRLNITNNNGETGTQFAEWELYEKRNQTILFDSIPDPTYGDDPFQLTANSNSGLPVSFEIVSGPATVDQNGFLMIIGTGTVTVRANQASNDNYFPASAEQTFTINKAPQNISFETIANKTYGDAPFELVASADTHLPLVSAVVSGPAIISGSMLTITGAGEITVRVSQAGNENYFPAVEEQSFLVNKVSQTILFTVIDPKNMIGTIQLSASSSSGLPISFSIVSGPGLLTGNNLSFTDAGQVTVRASQPGNENYLAANLVEQTMLVYGTDEKKDGIKIFVYPNPTHGQLRVKLDNKKDKNIRSRSITTGAPRLYPQ